MELFSREPDRCNPPKHTSLISPPSFPAAMPMQAQTSWGSTLPNGVANTERMPDPAAGVCTTEVSEKVDAQPGTPGPTRSTFVSEDHDNMSPQGLPGDPLGKWAKRALGVLSQKEEMTESDLKTYLMVDLFGALGYPNAPDAVLVEAVVQVGSGTQRADYVLLDMSGKPKVVVEVKASRLDLDQTVEAQGRSYAVIWKAPLLLLTNGRTYRVISCVGPETGEELNLEITLSDLVSTPGVCNEFLRLLGRGSDGGTELGSTLLELKGYLKARELLRRPEDCKEIVANALEHQLGSGDCVVSGIRKAVDEWFRPASIGDGPDPPRCSANNLGLAGSKEGRGTTTASEWALVPGSSSRYRHKSEPNCVIDVIERGNIVKAKLEAYGYKMKQTAFNGFYYTLRSDCGVIKRHNSVPASATNGGMP